jgi:predicted metal-dependent hydrolase
LTPIALHPVAGEASRSFTDGMPAASEQFEFPWSHEPGRSKDADSLLVGQRQVRLVLVRSRRARRYILRLRSDGAARVTVPRGGSAEAARRFAERNLPWLERQLQRQATRPAQPAAWSAGTSLFFRGERVQLQATASEGPGSVRFGTETLPVDELHHDWRPAVERHLQRLAARELPTRVLDLAALHQVTVRRVTVRNQRSRWGSCSRRGTISLNWRLIQAPPFVRDYLILHELMHLRQMNHSPQFWREVERVCPSFAEAERWLKQHAGLLH